MTEAFPKLVERRDISFCGHGVYDRGESKGGSEEANWVEYRGYIPRKALSSEPKSKQGGFRGPAPGRKRLEEIEEQKSSS